MYTYMIHACGHTGYIFIHAYGFEIALNILVFKTSHEIGVVDSSKDCFENGDNFSIFVREF